MRYSNPNMTNRIFMSTNPPFKRSGISTAIARATSPSFNSRKLVLVSQPISKKIKKNGPFEISKIAPEYPYFSHLMADLVRKIKELPDFSDDKDIAVMSDFGGEHQAAHFHTYSFLFLSYTKRGPFVQKMQELRKQHNLLESYSEFKYKDLKFGPRSRALPKYLELIDSFIHGALITVVIDKRIATVFGTTKQQAHPLIVEQLEKFGLGTWDGKAAEKALRVCHILSVFTSLLTKEGQRLFWYSDNDLINEDGKKRSFSDTQKIFQHTLGMYSDHPLELVGFGKSFDDKSHLDDLLSVPDLTAGVVQDLLQSQRTGEDIPGGDEKVAIIKWIAKQPHFLSKITLQIALTDEGEVGTGIVDIAPKADN